MVERGRVGLVGQGLHYDTAQNYVSFDAGVDITCKVPGPGGGFLSSGYLQESCGTEIS